MKTSASSVSSMLNTIRLLIASGLSCILAATNFQSCAGTVDKESAVSFSLYELSGLPISSRRFPAEVIEKFSICNGTPSTSESCANIALFELRTSRRIHELIVKSTLNFGDVEISIWPGVEVAK